MIAIVGTASTNGDYTVLRPARGCGSADCGASRPPVLSPSPDRLSCRGGGPPHDSAQINTSKLSSRAYRCTTLTTITYFTDCCSFSQAFSMDTQSSTSSKVLSYLLVCRVPDQQECRLKSGLIDRGLFGLGINRVDLLLSRLNN